jgi:hypothetical protein
MCIHHVKPTCPPSRSVIIDASMELALVVVLSTNFPAPELPAFIESVDGIEGAQHGLEVDVDYAVFVALVELYVLNRTELNVVSK